MVKLDTLLLIIFIVFDYSYQGRYPPQDLVAMVVDTNAKYDNQMWFMDSGGNEHITSNASILTTQQPFRESNSITVGNGSGLQIQKSALHPFD